MHREEIKSKILREVVILYFDHLMKADEEMLHTDLYDVFFHKWHKKLVSEDINDFSIDDLETFETDLEDILGKFHKEPSAQQEMSIHGLNHSLSKFRDLHNPKAN